MDSKHLYKDIKARTNGEIYIGIVGPVRTGKSTFIKRFMEVLVLPNMKNDSDRVRARDEMPQSASGKTIMTTEPKFIPKEAAEIQLMDEANMKIRLIDCVGYMVDGAVGHIEGGAERQVKTPWFDYEIPFTKAASIGTKKVIHDHATIGIVITTDGTIGELERKQYLEAEEKTIKELQTIGKPFVVLLNSTKPYGQETMDLASQLEAAYQVPVIPVNCEQLKESDIQMILEKVLRTFPVSKIEFYIPKWVEMLPWNHKIKAELIEKMREILNNVDRMDHAYDGISCPESIYIENMRIEKLEMDTGCIKIRMDVPERFYYEMLSEMTGTSIEDQYELMEVLKNLSMLKAEYEGVRDAFESVQMKGYGVVTPTKEEIALEEPVIIKQGNKYGVKIHSTAPSIHLIRANIETEITPIVGNEQQAKDLITYIKETSDKEGGIWETNIFGKSIENLVLDGIRNKIAVINDESQEKLQNTMQKIVNDSNGGMVCIII